MFDTIKNIYEFKGEMVNLTPIHIGSARSFSPIEADNPVIRDINDIPYIPGSSLRGIIRSAVEVLARSRGKNVCKGIDTEKWCVDPTERKEYKTEDEWATYVINNVCDVCRLFGSGVIASRVRIFDAYIKEKRENGYTFIKDGVAIRRDTRTAKDKAKYDYEVVYPYNKFDFRMTVQDPTKEEKEYLIGALTMLDKGLIQIGGKKGAGFGKVKISYTIRLITIDDILGGGEGKEVNVDTFLREGN